MIEGKISCGVGRVKEETIKDFFVRVFNRLKTEGVEFLREYKARLKREKFDDGQMAKLDEEIQSLIQQLKIALGLQRPLEIERL